MTRRSPNLRLHPSDLLEIHPHDASLRGISDGHRVRLRSQFGEAHAVARLTERVKPGEVFLSFHDPETATNSLIGDVRDRETNCP